MSRIRVAAVATGGRTVVSELSGCEPWRPRVVPTPGAGARVVLVQSRALLLSGDLVQVSVRVGAGAALSVSEIGATIAHHVRGGAPARLSVDAVVEPGGRLEWFGSPLVLASGSALTRATAIALAAGARLLLAEAVALGRARQEPGELVARTRIVAAGEPLLDETIDTRERSVLRSPVVADASQLLGAVTIAGVRDPDPPDGAMQAHGEATVWRAVGEAVGVTRSVDAIARRWSALVAAGGEGASRGDLSGSREVIGALGGPGGRRE